MFPHQPSVVDINIDKMIAFFKDHHAEIITATTSRFTKTGQINNQDVNSYASKLSPSKEFMHFNFEEYRSQMNNAVPQNLNILVKRGCDKQIKELGFNPIEEKRELFKPDIGHKSIEDMIEDVVQRKYGHHDARFNDL